MCNKILKVRNSCKYGCEFTFNIRAKFNFVHLKYFKILKKYTVCTLSVPRVFLNEHNRIIKGYFYTIYIIYSDLVWQMHLMIIKG